MEMGRADESRELDELLNGGYRYAMSLCHDPAEAEDLVQDARARILGTGGPMERPYLLATIRNRFIDRYRRVFVHIMMCRHCRRYLKQMRAIGDAAREVFRGDPQDKERDKGNGWYYDLLYLVCNLVVLTTGGGAIRVM